MLIIHLFFLMNHWVRYRYSFSHMLIYTCSPKNNSWIKSVILLGCCIAIQTDMWQAPTIYTGYAKSVL